MEQSCATCKHFYQHYVRHGRGYVKTGSGHCVYPRIKLRHDDTPACKHYGEKPAPKEKAD